ncbi:MAG: hypothetical protein ACI4N4_08250 [Candidatus Fimenecus sp.]
MIKSKKTVGVKEKIGSLKLPIFICAALHKNNAEPKANRVQRYAGADSRT